MEVDLGQLHAERARRLAAQQALSSRASGDPAAAASAPTSSTVSSPISIPLGSVSTTAVRDVCQVLFRIIPFHAGSFAFRTHLARRAHPCQDFDCSLCMKLLVEPVSLACGHTYCRACLIRAISVQACCPYCRAPSFASPRDQPQNYLLSKIIPQVSASASRWGVFAREMRMFVFAVDALVSFQESFSKTYPN